METKHTKKEWHVNSTGVFSQDGNLVANCVSDGIHFTEEDKANAQLISAAPAMLEALNSMIKMFDRGLPEGTLGGSAILKAKEAINKATK